VSVNYHVQKNSPQAFEFDADGIIGNLISPELEETRVKVTDVRECALTIHMPLAVRPTTFTMTITNPARSSV